MKVLGALGILYLYIWMLIYLIYVHKSVIIKRKEGEK